MTSQLRPTRKKQGARLIPDSYPTHTREGPWPGKVAGPTRYRQVFFRPSLRFEIPLRTVICRVAVSAQRHCCVAAVPPKGGGACGTKQDREDIVQVWLQRDGVNQELRREFDSGVGARPGEPYHRFRQRRASQSSRSRRSQPCWLQVASGKLPLRCASLRQQWQTLQASVRGAA